MASLWWVLPENKHRAIFIILVLFLSGHLTTFITFHPPTWRSAHTYKPVSATSTNLFLLVMSAKRRCYQGTLLLSKFHNHNNVMMTSRTSQTFTQRKGVRQVVGTEAIPPPGQQCLVQKRPLSTAAWPVLIVQNPWLILRILLLMFENTQDIFVYICVYQYISISYFIKCSACMIVCWLVFLELCIGSNSLNLFKTYYCSNSQFDQLARTMQIHGPSNNVPIG